MYDIVVVGGGPAGLSAARAAAQRGAKVVVLEQEEAIAQHVRTSGVTWLSDAGELGIPQELCNPVSTYTFFSPHRQASVKSSSPMACVLDVRGTYQFLAGRAADAGAEIMLRTRANRPLRGEGGRVLGVEASTGGVLCEYRAPLVVDASGFHSVVAREVGVGEPWVRYGAGAEYEAYAENVVQDEWYLMVGSPYSPAGYAWVFPTGGKMVRIGVGVGKPNSGANPSSLLEELLRLRPGPLRGLGRVVPVEFHYGLVPNQGLRSRLTGGGLALAGDSAGQANPIVLEGIRYAMRYGGLLGKVAAGFSEVALNTEYERVCRSEIEPKIKAALRVQARWLSLSDAGWDREVGILEDLTPDEFMQFIRADFTAATMARLASRHPTLAVRELFGMAVSALGLDRRTGAGKD